MHCWELFLVTLELQMSSGFAQTIPGGLGSVPAPLGAVCPLPPVLGLHLQVPLQPRGALALEECQDSLTPLILPAVSLTFSRAQVTLPEQIWSTSRASSDSGDRGEGHRSVKCTVKHYSVSITIPLRG